VRAPAIALAIGLAGAACEMVTHAFDYQVGSVPAGGICAACPGGRDLRHPPCPVSSAGGRAEGSFAYAARRSRLGVAPGSPPSFDLGLDLDCSDRRPTGLPVLCAPRSTAGWQPLPGGVDDALLARVLAPAAAATPPGRGVDLDAAVSEAFERGRYGVVIAVDGWNGRADDPTVVVTIRTSPGLVQGAAPAWTGGDRWARYPDVDDDGARPFAIDRAAGYVAGGTLVVDERARGATLFRFGPSGARFELLLSRLVFTGTLTPSALARFTMTGVVDQPSASAAALALATALGTCAGGAAGVFLASLPALFAVAADMPFAADADPRAPCDGVSFAWSVDAEPALLAEEGSEGRDAGALCP
jgi:hypothetical protein